MRKSFLFGWLFLFSIYAFAQAQETPNESREKTSSKITMFDLKRNSIYNEDLLIFCYERLLPIENKFAIALKGGFMVVDPILPLGEVTSVLGGSKHFFEGGIGALLDPFVDEENGDENTIFFTIRIGYRYMAPRGFLLKTSILYSPDVIILPLISLGYSF